MLPKVRRSWFAVFIATLATLSACSGDDSKGPGPYEAQCVDFAHVACSSNAKCAVETGAIAASDQQSFTSGCESSAVNALNCPAIRAVVGSVETCKMDYQSTPCTMFMLPNGLPVPNSCRGLFVK